MTETVKLTIRPANSPKGLIVTVPETASIMQVINATMKLVRDTKPHWEAPTLEFHSFSNCGGWETAKGIEITAFHAVIKAYSEMTLEELYDTLLAAKVDKEIMVMSEDQKLMEEL